MAASGAPVPALAGHVERRPAQSQQLSALTLIGALMALLTVALSVGWKSQHRT